MLQPRIPIRSLPLRHLSSKIFLPQLTHSRTYASVMETPTASPPDAPLDAFNITAEPPPIRDEALTGQSALRRYTPRTPGVRHLVRPVNEHLYKGRPVFDLTFPKKGQSRGGRNRTGHVTVRHRGGGHKRRIRVVDFYRHAQGEHYVERIEHDPGRSAHIALVTNKQTGQKSYIVAAEGLRAGDTVQSYRSGIPQELLDSMGGSIDHGVLASKTAWRGNCLPLGMIPLGTPIFNISLQKDGKAQYCRSAGTHGFVIGKGEDAVQKELIKQLEAKRVRDKAAAVEKGEKEKAEAMAKQEAKKLARKETAEKGTAEDSITKQPRMSCWKPKRQTRKANNRTTVNFNSATTISESSKRPPNT
jgi:ribosomal protein L2